MAKKELLSSKNIMIFAAAFVALIFLLQGTGSRTTLQVENSCMTEGNFCLGTGELWTCDMKSDGTYVASLLETCDDGYICDSRSGDCNPKHECAETTVPIWYLQGDECVFNELGHGCLDPEGDGVTTFGTEAACKEKIAGEKAGMLNIVPPEGTTGYYIFAGILALLATGLILYIKGKKK